MHFQALLPPFAPVQSHGIFQRAVMQRLAAGLLKPGDILGILGGIVDMEDFKKKCGPRWCYIFQDAILQTALPTGTVHPSLALAVEDSARQFARSCLLDSVRLGKKTVKP